MKDYKLKVILTVLSAVVFSMLFILLALVIPFEKEPAKFEKSTRTKSTLQKISEGINR